MDVAQIAAFQVASAAALTQQAISMEVAKQAAAAQMQMAKVIEQQTKQVNEVTGFSVYA